MISVNKQYSQELREKLGLVCEPVAVKFARGDGDVPPGALRPVADIGGHMALCQAFTLARRENKTIYMEKADHWCWNPLVGLGHVDCDEGTRAFDVVCTYLGIKDADAARRFFAKFPRLPQNSVKGIVTAPLCEADFEPDVTMIYCDNIQLRSMLWSIKSITGKLVSTELDAIDSCVYACVTPELTGDYRVTLPDLGETERAMASPDEIILSVPRGKLPELLSALYPFPLRPAKALEYDFERPPFYKELFELWNM